MDVEITSIIIASIALIVAIITLVFIGESVREMVAAQRAQTGPFIKVSFDIEPYDPSLINPPHTNLDFLPVRRRSWGDLVIGERAKSNKQASDKRVQLILRIENVQEHFSGIASDIKIELIGWWWLSLNGELRKLKSRFVHLRHSCEVLNPGEQKKLNAPGIWKVSGFKVEVRKLTYKDAWGHSCRAFCGHKFCLHSGIPQRGELETWESVVPDMPKRATDPIYQKDYYIPLLREKFIRLFSFCFRR